MTGARWLWTVGLGCGAGAVPAGTPGPPRLRADRRRSGTGIPQARGYRRGEPDELLLDDKACIRPRFAYTGRHA